MEKTHLIWCPALKTRTESQRYIQEEMEKTHLIRQGRKARDTGKEEEMEKTHLIRCPALKTSTESQRYWYTGGNGEDPPDSVFKGGNGEDPPDSVSSGGNGDDPPDSVSSSKDNADPPDSVSSSKDKDRHLIRCPEEMEKTHLIRCSSRGNGEDPPDSVSHSKDKDGKPEILGRP
ncbi:unnamed protein product [Rodentolepis nana]|uniref:Protein phosphatase inhibitor 2 n=1 Tax=Rodentolepis nana TaxID=102285 RepID=A0A0R3THT2_RODNA|nr:unnamed protein product [Rodentolepis nana]